MQALFLEILNMSLTSAYVIAVIMIIRLMVRKLPKKYSYWLWSAAAFRLCCPLSFQSVLSIFNFGFFDMSRAQSESGARLEYVADNIGYQEIPQVSVGIPYANTLINNVLPEAHPSESVNPMQIVLTVSAVLWAVGVVLMLICGIVSYIKIRRSMSTAMKLEGNIYQSDKISSPFILGIFKPKIYIPFGIYGETLRYVLIHEKYHIKRFDHIVKIAAYLILSVHWFNPMCWAAFILMGTDMEMSCDEKVLASEDNIRKEYSTSLLSFATSGRFPSPGPIAFGETGVRSRIKNALRFKKPKLWAGIVAVTVCVAVAVVCVSNPMFMRITDINDAGDYEKIFDEIYSITVINSRGSQFLKEEDEISRVVEVLESLKISRDNISRNENRNKVNSVMICDNENDKNPLFIYFNEDFSQLWINDGVKPSFTYKVKNPEEMSVFSQYGTLLTAENIKAVEQKLKTDKVSLFDFFIKDDILIAGCSYEGKLGFAVFMQNENGGYELEEARRYEELITRTSDKSMATSYFIKQPHDYMVIMSNNPDFHRVETKGDLNVKMYAKGCPTMLVIDMSGLKNSESGFTYSFLDSSGKDIGFPSEGEEYPKGGTETVYVYHSGNELVDPALTLDNGKFQFNWSLFSSYIARGSYKTVGDMLILETDDGVNTYFFRIEENAIVFDASQSSKIPSYKYHSGAEPLPAVPDGATFYVLNE